MRRRLARARHGFHVVRCARTHNVRCGRIVIPHARASRRERLRGALAQLEPTADTTMAMTVWEREAGLRPAQPPS